MNNEELFRDYIRAYNTKDVDRMLAFFDEDCLFENISGGKLTIRTKGKSELGALARKSVEAFATRDQKILSLTRGQGRVIAEIEYRGVLKSDLTPDLKAGTRLQLRGISVAEFSRGKILRLTDYS